MPLLVKNIPVSVVDILYIFMVALLLLMTILIYFHNRRSLMNRRYTLFLVCTLCFTIISVGTKMRFWPPYIFVYHMAFSCYAGYLFYLFSRAVTRRQESVQWYDYVWISAGVYFLGYVMWLTLSPDVFATLKNGIYFTDTGMVRAYTKHWSYRFFLLFYITGFILGIVHLFRNIATSDLIQKKQIRLVLLGTITGLLIFVITGNILPAVGYYRLSNFSLLGLVLGFSIVAFSIVSNKSWKLEKQLDEDRLRISRELHDLVASEITGLLFYLKTKTDSNVEKKVIEDSLNNSLTNIRDLVYILKGDKEIHENFEAILFETVERYATVSGIKFKAQIASIGKTVGAFSCLQVHRILLEVLTNIIKHSNAKLVKIRWHSKGGYFFLIIQDNGKGLPLQFSRYNGLKNIKDRASKMNGRARFFSVARKTTVIAVIGRLPLNTT
jgi:signal transduction histidine kinase